MKLIYSDFNEATNETIITIADRYGRYTGKAKLHPDDTNNYIVGGTIAEARAKINFYKSRIRREKIRLQTLISLKNEFNFLPEGITFLNQKIEMHKKNIKDFETAIEYQEQYIKDYIKRKSELLKKIKDKMDKNK